MKAVKITYWITTGLLALMMAFSGFTNLMSTKESLEMLQHLGYPAYLSPFLGLAKLLAVVAILVPGFPRVKEWAYAGLTFDVTGAAYSFISIGEPMNALPILIAYALIATSVITYRKLMKSRLTHTV